MTRSKLRLDAFIMPMQFISSRAPPGGFGVGAGETVSTRRFLAESAWCRRHGSLRPTPIVPHRRWRGIVA